MPAATVDQVTRALADPTRREILQLVRDQEHTVGHLAGQFSMTRPAISQHLRILRDADLVEFREEGTRNYYRARPAGLAGLRAWMEEFWGDALDRLKAEVEAETGP